MSESIFIDITVHVASLTKLIEQEQYDTATIVCDNLAKSIKQLSRSELLALSYEEQRYLYELAKWLSDEDGTMNKRSRELIEVIAPFNKKCDLKINRKYPGKNSHG